MGNVYRVVLISRTWNGKRSIKIKAQAPNREAAELARLNCYGRLPEHVDANYRVYGPKQFAKLQAEIKAEQRERRIKGAKRAAEKRARLGIEKKFILCPTCQSKSKKLRSEMGGLQTRQCRQGHYFEVDTFFGIETHKRRVENIERPYFTPGGGNYTDWVNGRYKDDPLGKQDMTPEQRKQVEGK